MFLNKRVAEDLVINLAKVNELEVSVLDHRAVLVGATDTAAIGMFNRDAFKVINDNYKMLIKEETAENGRVGFGKLLLPIYVDRKVIGVVGIFGSIENILLSENVAKTVIELTVKGLNGSAASQQSNTQRLIGSIISPLKYDQETRTELLSSINPAADWIVIVFEVYRKDDGKDLSCHQLEQVLRSLNSAKAVDLLERVSPRQFVMLKKVKVGPRGWDHQATTREIEGQCEGLLRYPWLDLFASCGNYYEGVERLAISYQSAIHSLAIGKQQFPEQRIYNYNDMALDVLLLSTSNNWTSEYLERSYCNLISNDKNGCLQKTLKCFFGSNLNFGKAAEDLHVHRNTLRYRLAKIRDYTGLDMSNIDNIFFLYSALKIHGINRDSVSRKLVV
ncbi:MAG: helix-turn-helix domain-containing protein [Motiliproteus sp.]